MFFCANSKCKFHVNAPVDLYQLTLQMYRPRLEMMLSERSEPSLSNAEAINETREKHRWRDPKTGRVWFLCDVCNNAAMMVISK